MRLMHRPLLLILPLASLSCAEHASSVQPSGHNVGRVALAPTFEPAAARAYQALATPGTTVVSIHVVLTNLAGRAVVDTTIAFPATQDTVSVDLPVPISGQQEQFDALVELRDASGAVQFASRQRITVRSSGGGSTPLPISLQYVGPGSSVSLISVSPSNTTLQAVGPPPLTATGADAAGQSGCDAPATITACRTPRPRLGAAGDITAKHKPPRPPTG